MGIIAKQGIWNTGILYTGVLLGFINLLVLQPKLLSTEEVGLIRLLFSFASIVATIIPLGITNTTIRYYPRFRDPEKNDHGYFGFMLLYPLVGTILTATLMFLASGFVIGHYQAQSPLFASFYYHSIILVILLGFISVFNIYCFARYRSIFPSFLNEIVVRIMIITLILFYWLGWIDFQQFVILFIGNYVIALLILLIFIFKNYKPSLKINFEVFKKAGLKSMFVYGFLLTLTSFSSLGMKYIDIIVLAKYLPLSVTGIYAVVAFIPFLIEMPLNALNKTANFKVSDALQSKNMEEIKKLYTKSAVFLLIIGGWLFLTVTVNAYDALKFLPDVYSEGLYVIIILSISALFTMASGINSSIIFNSKHYLKGISLLFVLVIMNLTLNILLIPVYGLLGAAIATTISGLFYSFGKYFIIKYYFGLSPFNFKILLNLLLIALFFIVFYNVNIFDNYVFNIAIKTIIFTPLYFYSLILLKVLPDIKSIYSMIRIKI